jgi:hypothetical protein
MEVFGAQPLTAGPAQFAPGGRDSLAALASSFMAVAPLARARSTIDHHRPAWRKFCEWLEGRLHDFNPYLATGTLVALYLTEVLDRSRAVGIGPGAVQNASAAIACMFRLAGRPSPTDHPACGTVREVAKRTLVPQRLEREPLVAQDLQLLVARFAGAGCPLRDLMHVTAFVLMFAGFLRYDDLAKVLVHQDLLKVQPTHLEVFIYKAKTDQYWEGNWVQIAALPGSPCCPVTLARRLLEAGRYVTAPPLGRDAGPLIRAVHVDGPGHRLAQVTAPLAEPIPPLSDAALRDRLKAMCAAVGIAKPVGLHSLRIGGATAAAGNGVPERLVQAHGRWASQAVARGYMRAGQEERLGVSRQLGL